MFAKFGFVLLILLFGALAFAGGMMAPANWRGATDTLASHWQDAMHALTADKSSNGNINASKPAAAATSATPTTAANVPAASTSTAPLQLGDLLVKTTVDAPAPAKGQPAYALELGQYVTTDEADTTEQQFEVMADRLNLPLTTLAVVGADKQPWTVLAIGQFTSEAAARQAEARVQNTLKIENTPVIELPPSAKPAS